MSPPRVINQPQYRFVATGNTYSTNEAMVRDINKHMRLPPREKEAMTIVDRRHFVPLECPYIPFRAVPLAGGLSSASRPFTVAHMVRLLGSIEGKKVLEIGSGSGYQTAILAETSVKRDERQVDAGRQLAAHPGSLMGLDDGDL